MKKKQAELNLDLDWLNSLLSDTVSDSSYTCLELHGKKTASESDLDIGDDSIHHISLNSPEKKLYTNYRDMRPFNFLIAPKQVSCTGLNLFRVINCRYDYKYQRYSVRLEMYGKQHHVVKFYRIRNTEQSFKEDISKLKEIMKKGLDVYISLDDLSLLSYRFNNSSGISMYSAGFRIALVGKVISDDFE